MSYRRLEKKWLLQQLPENISKEYLYRISKDTGVSEKIVKILMHRGISDKQTINDFLNPSLDKLPRPHLMKGMPEVVKILLEALESKRPVSVYGDFDADGVTSTAVLSLFFKELNMVSTHYIPERLTEGYGLNLEAVKKIYENNNKQWGEPGILMTVDCGISDAEVIDQAKRLGFTVIITDHHKPPEKLPAADAIINPLQPGCDFPCKDLAGVGVVFYLILGLRSELMENCHWPEDKIPNLKSYMDLVAIGTVADQVPITGCNRIIVKAGLEVLKQGNRVGIQKLLTTTKGYESSVTTEDIAFCIAPRINAIGRIGSALKAVELLKTRNHADAEILANELENANNERKNIEAGTFDDAVQMISVDILRKTNSLLLYKNNWHQGVLGIVASRLTDKYNRPAILLTDCIGEKDTTGFKTLVKGSGRSVKGIDIHLAVSKCREMLERFGGHEGAVGLTLPKENIVPLQREFDRVIGEQLVGENLISDIIIDAEASLNELLDNRFISSYNLLAPFGSGNPDPVFSMKGQKLTNARLVGNNHLRFTIMDKGKSMSGIGFGFGDFIHDAQKSPVDIAFVLKLNSYMGQNKWEIRLIALRPTNH
jgi:single-stranded-DNA-specific exonuclease